MGRAVGGVALVGTACVAYGTFIESASYRVRRVDVPVLKPGSEPLRVLHLSDAHLLPMYARRRAFLRSLAGLEPDLVVSTGDSLAGEDGLPALIESLGRLLDVPGVFVFGSNDYVAPRMKNPVRYLWRATGKPAPQRASLPTEELRAAFTSRGWLDLNDRRAELTIRGQRFAFRGTDDAHEHRDDYPAVAGPADPDAVNIGVTHAPYLRMLDAMTADGVEMIFAGHTHGGQVCVPGRGALTSNCDLPVQHAKGLFRHTTGDKTSWVNVSAGIGMSPYAPFRFACPPEVSLLTLVPRAEGASARRTGRLK
nr:metallophosphoesterase [Nigerium massiliense]